ncbi:MAG: T9SS type A sorting domain-containing protein [Bacteroidetes bacterium]|nr:T9SS type A sorting domain-containing protein [Bacteroidota bacterium]
MKHFLTIAIVLAFSTAAFAQQPAIRCHTNEFAAQHTDVQTQQNYADAENRITRWLEQHPDAGNTRTTIVIPVIFHVVYNNAQGNVAPLRLIEQLDVLNEDFGGYNSDYGNTPAVWQPISGNTDIQFCLAHVNPQGGWTNGYEYYQTNASLCTFSNIFTTAPGWNPNNYLNIWVVQCNNSVLGFAAPPGSPATEDGVVIMHNYIGQTGASAPYDLGRTATHEVGHWLGLQHIWGDDGGACTGTDNVADTPNQADNTFGCQAVNTVLTDACSPAAPGIMWMNYMDYSDDACMYMFTQGQKARMWATINSVRAGLLTSTVCQITGTSQQDLQPMPALFPNPAQQTAAIEIPQGYGDVLSIDMYTASGQLVWQQNQPALNEQRIMLDLSTFETGVYFIRLRTAGGNTVLKLIRE